MQKSIQQFGINKIYNYFLFIFLSIGIFASHSLALPQNPTVQSGEIDIKTTADQINVIQGSDKAIIDWKAFSIDANEAVKFQLSSSNGITLNRVTGNDISSILGKLSSNGRIVLINPNGIIFGDTATVDVRGLVATTSDISNWDFMNGKMNFNTPSNNSSAVVINKGAITVADGGLVALVAPGVANSGVINARLGKVSLVSGNTFTLDLYGDQLINLAVNDSMIKKATGMYGNELDAMVSNSGEIYADGGIVTLEVGTAQNILDQVINMDGVIQAKSFQTDKRGTIVLDGRGGKVNVSGKLDASGKWGQQKGGVVRVSGKNVELGKGARIDVSAHAGEGEVYIGGLAKSNTQNSYRTALNMGSEVNADQLMGWGKGGKIVVKGTTASEVYGTLSAKKGTIDIRPTEKKASDSKPTQPSIKLEMKPMIKPGSKPNTKSETKPESKPESRPKPSDSSFGSIIRNTNSPAVGIGGVQLAQNFNTGSSTTGIGGVEFNSSSFSEIIGSGNRGRNNGLGGVSSTSSSNSSPISSIRSETFAPPGQAKRGATEQNESIEPNINISGASTPSTFTTSSFSGIGGVELPIEIQSEAKNVQSNGKSRSATDSARSQRLRNL
jgi:filamentous hemagglutinin family protein